MEHSIIKHSPMTGLDASPATTTPAPWSAGQALRDFWRACVRAFDLSGAHGPMPPL